MELLQLSTLLFYFKELVKLTSSLLEQQYHMALSLNRLISLVMFKLHISPSLYLSVSILVLVSVFVLAYLILSLCLCLFPQSLFCSLNVCLSLSCVLSPAVSCFFSFTFSLYHCFCHFSLLSPPSSFCLSLSLSHSLLLFPLSLLLLLTVSLSICLSFLCLSLSIIHKLLMFQSEI